jgi:hypothetical protein
LKKEKDMLEYRLAAWAALFLDQGQSWNFAFVDQLQERYGEMSK